MSYISNLETLHKKLKPLALQVYIDESSIRDIVQSISIDFSSDIVKINSLKASLESRIISFGDS